MIKTEDDLRKKCLELVNSPPLPIIGKSDRRFGATVENYFGIQPNNKSSSDLESLDMDIKTKVNLSCDLTLFASRPHYLRTDKNDFLSVYGNEEEDGRSFYSDVSSRINKTGFQLIVKEDNEDIEMCVYDTVRHINRASMHFGHIKHCAKIKMKNILLACGEKVLLSKKEHLQINSLSIYSNLTITNSVIKDLLLNNKMIYSFRAGSKKDHGGAFRLTDIEHLKILYSNLEIIERK